MQKCESRTKRVMSAIIAGMMALQVVAPTISYADDTVASTASSEDNSDTQIDPGVPVQTKCDDYYQPCQHYVQHRKADEVLFPLQGHCKLHTKQRHKNDVR